MSTPPSQVPFWDRIVLHTSSGDISSGKLTPTTITKGYFVGQLEFPYYSPLSVYGAIVDNPSSIGGYICFGTTCKGYEYLFAGEIRVYSASNLIWGSYKKQVAWPVPMLETPEGVAERANIALRAFKAAILLPEIDPGDTGGWEGNQGT